MTWFAVALLGAVAGAQDAQRHLLKTKSFTLGEARVDRVYRSMTGPLLTADESLQDGGRGPLWLKGLRVEVLGLNGKPESLEYLCHAAIAFDSPQSEHGIGLMTISPGMQEMHFPEGFAMLFPETKRRSFDAQAQALNNDPAKLDKRLKFAFTVEYYDTQAAEQLRLKPLYFKDIHVVLGGASGHQAGHPGQPHFPVPPGRHKYRTPVSFSSSGNIHFIKLHLHAFGESVELRDMTMGETVWKGWGRTDVARQAIVHTDSYSSAQGLAVDRTHAYELVTVYDNKTRSDVDAMAFLRLYLDAPTAAGLEGSKGAGGIRTRE